MGKALDRLAAYPPTYLGIDVSALRAHCAAARRDVMREAEGWRERVAPGSLDFVANRVRGDEVELREADPDA